jgi:hypothetical protein
VRNKHRLYLSIVSALLVWPLATACQTTPAAPSFSVTVLAQSPADTKTELQIFCLFRSSPENQLHGSLIEIDEKLHGLLTQVRQPGLFGGELGETMLLTPPSGSLAAKKVLIIGLGDSSTFTPERMYLAGKIAFREASRLGIAHPFFAPTVLDGGVSGFPTGAVAYQVVRGLRDALATETILRRASATAIPAVVDVTFLAGAAHVMDTQKGIDQAFGR